MSNVTDCVLVWTLESDDGVTSLKAVNDYFIGWGRPKTFYEVREAGPNPFWYASGKALQSQVAIAACNHLNLPEFVEHLKTKVPWQDVSNVQLFVQEEEFDGWQLINVLKH